MSSTLTAKSIMTTPVILVGPGLPIRDAAQIMLERHISGLPVVDAEAHLIGIVTEADLLLKEAFPKPAEPLLSWHGRSLWLERRVAGFRKAEGRTVGEVMTRNVLTAEEDTPVHVLASLMVRSAVNRIPIVRDRTVVGIVTRNDVLKVFVRNDEILEREARPVVAEFLRSGEEVAVSIRHGVCLLAGVVGSPGRRAALLRALWTVDGVVAIDDRELREAHHESTAMWE